MDVVKEANPASIITVETLAKKRATPTMTLAHWRRFVCNLPTRPDTAAVTEAEWFAARSAEEIPEGEPVWVGLDLGWKYDTTAIVPLWVRDREFRLFGPAVVLTPPMNGEMLDSRDIERALVLLDERNPVETVVMDPHRGEQMAQWIEQELGARVIERQQTIPLMALDYSRFMEALREGWLHHAGDEVFARHVLNAVAKVLPRGDIIFERPVKSSRSTGEQHRRVVDALDAAAMVHSTLVAQWDEVVPEAFFEFA
jgi:phage terminase large subunit-like protein